MRARRTAPAALADVGPRSERRAILEDRGGGFGVHDRARCGSGCRRTALRRAEERGRENNPAARRGRRRPVTRPRLARARAVDARGPRASGHDPRLAPVHHLIIGRTIPVRELIDWLAELGASWSSSSPTATTCRSAAVSRKREGSHPEYARRSRVRRCGHASRSSTPRSFRLERGRSTTHPRSDEAPVVPPAFRAPRGALGVRRGSAVFSMLKGNPEFLVIRGAARLDTAVFAVTLAFVPPLVAVALEALRRLVSRRPGSPARRRALVLRVHGAPAVANRFDPAVGLTMVFPALASYAGTLADLRRSLVRSFLSCRLPCRPSVSRPSSRLFRSRSTMPQVRA